jgi:hypothetical protein
VLEDEKSPIDAEETASHFLAAGEPALHTLADCPAELAILAELAVQPGRRDFEIVRLLDQRRRVEYVANFATDTLAVVDPYSPRLIHKQAEHAPGSARPKFQIHERQPVIQEHRLHNLLDLELPFVFLHRCTQK